MIHCTDKEIKFTYNDADAEAIRRFLNQNTNTTSEGDDNTMDELERKSYECAKDTVMKLQAMNQELQGRIRELETELHQAKFRWEYIDRRTPRIGDDKNAKQSK